MKEYSVENLRLLSTEELDMLLCEELDKENLDRDRILAISGIIEARESNTPVPKDIRIQKAWKKFRATESVSPPSAKPGAVRRWVAGIAAAAAIVCLVTAFSTPTVVGAESVGELLARWSNEILEFFNPQENPKGTRDVFQTDHPGLQQLYDAAAELGLEDLVVPTWLPEGYELTELKKMVATSKHKVSAVFERDGSYITIIVRAFSDATNKYFTDEIQYQVYEVSSVPFCVFSNDGKWEAIGTKGSIECVVTTNLGEETLHKIIDSIYVEETH